jgi:rubrerythrin
MVYEYIRKQDAIELCNNPLSEQSMRLVPPADVVPVVHGKWNKLSYDGFNCNKCGSTFVIMQGKENMHFCPNCGAKMVE